MHRILEISDIVNYLKNISRNTKKDYVLHLHPTIQVLKKNVKETTVPFITFMFVLNRELEKLKIEHKYKDDFWHYLDDDYLRIFKKGTQ